MLTEIGAADKDQIYVFNKTDLLEDPIFSKRKYIPISAMSGLGIGSLIDTISEKLFDQLLPATFFIPYTDGQVLNEIMNRCEITATSHEETGTKVEAITDQMIRGKYQKYLMTEE